MAASSKKINLKHAKIIEKLLPWKLNRGWVSGLTESGGAVLFPDIPLAPLLHPELVVRWTRFTPSPDNGQREGLFQKHPATYSHFIDPEWVVYLLLNQSLQKNIFTSISIKSTFRIRVRSSFSKTRVSQSPH